MPSSTAKKYHARFKVAVAIIVILIGGLGAIFGMFAGDLMAASIFASPDASIDGRTFGGTIGFALAVWYAAIAAKGL
jgi:hypothetical protein